MDIQRDPAYNNPQLTFYNGTNFYAWTEDLFDELKVMFILCHTNTLQTNTIPINVPSIYTANRLSQSPSISSIGWLVQDMWCNGYYEALNQDPCPINNLWQTNSIKFVNYPNNGETNRGSWLLHLTQDYKYSYPDEYLSGKSLMYRFSLDNNLNDSTIYGYTLAPAAGSVSFTNAGINGQALYFDASTWYYVGGSITICRGMFWNHSNYGTQWNVDNALTNNNWALSFWINTTNQTAIDPVLDVLWGMVRSPQSKLKRNQLTDFTFTSIT